DPGADPPSDHPLAHRGTRRGDDRPVGGVAIPQRLQRSNRRRRLPCPRRRFRRRPRARFRAAWRIRSRPADVVPAVVTNMVAAAHTRARLALMLLGISVLAAIVGALSSAQQLDLVQRIVARAFISDSQNEAN